MERTGAQSTKTRHQNEKRTSNNNDERTDEHCYRNFKRQKNKIVKSILRRLKTVVDAKRYPTKY